MDLVDSFEFRGDMTVYLKEETQFC